MRAGIGAAVSLHSSPIPDQALEGLTDGQRAAARLILKTPGRTVGAQGHAGTGKTVMLRRVAAFVGGCVKARKNGEQRSPVPAIRGAGDDSERRVGV